MTGEQWIGVLLVFLGLYFAICATLFPGIVLFKLKVARAESIFGEKNAHRFYLLLGIVLLAAGTLKAAGLF